MRILDLINNIAIHKKLRPDWSIRHHSKIKNTAIYNDGAPFCEREQGRVRASFGKKSTFIRV